MSLRTTKVVSVVGEMEEKALFHCSFRDFEVRYCVLLLCEKFLLVNQEPRLKRIQQSSQYINNLSSMRYICMRFTRQLCRTEAQCNDVMMQTAFAFQLTRVGNCLSWRALCSPTSAPPPPAPALVVLRGALIVKASSDATQHSRSLVNIDVVTRQTWRRPCHQPGRQPGFQVWATA